MKEKKSQKISIKKLTIARINVESLGEIRGGSSHPTQVEGEDHGACYQVQ